MLHTNGLIKYLGFSCLSFQAGGYMQHCFAKTGGVQSEVWNRWACVSRSLCHDDGYSTGYWVKASKKSNILHFKLQIWPEDANELVIFRENKLEVSNCLLQWIFTITNFIDTLASRALCKRPVQITNVRGKTELGRRKYWSSNS